MSKLKTELAEKMVKLIKIEGLPVGFFRQEADGGYGIVIDNKGKVYTTDYATEYGEYQDGITVLKDLSFIDLAFLVEHPIRGAELENMIKGCNLPIDIQKSTGKTKTTKEEKQESLSEIFSVDEFIPSRWDLLTERQKDDVCHHPGLPQDFICSHWNEMTEHQKFYIYLDQKLSEDFISSVWNETTEFQRGMVCRHQNLSQDFISSVWNELIGGQRDDICHHQILSQEFIFSKWEELTEKQKDDVCHHQKLSEEFMREKGNELTKTQKANLCLNPRIADIMEQFFKTKKEQEFKADNNSLNI